MHGPLTGKCHCIISIYRVKASEFFSPLQLGVACSAGAENLIHGCVAVFQNIGRMMILLPARLTLGMPLMRYHNKTLLEECATHFPELFRWVFLGVMDNIPSCGTPWVLWV